MANIHVDAANGNDTTGNCSQAAPFKTLTKALVVKANGDQVLLFPGAYETEPIFPTSQGNGFVVDVPDLSINPFYDNGSYGVTVRKAANRADSRVINYVPTADAAVGGGLRIGPVVLDGGDKTLIETGSSNTVFYRARLDRTKLQQAAAAGMTGIRYNCKRFDLALLNVLGQLTGNSYGIVGSTAAAQSGSVLGTDIAGALYEGHLYIEGGDFSMASMLGPCPPIVWTGFPSAVGSVKLTMIGTKVQQRLADSWAVRAQGALLRIVNPDFVGGIYARNVNNKAGFAAGSEIAGGRIVKPWGSAHGILIGEDVQYLLGNINTYDDVLIHDLELFDSNPIGAISHGVHIDQNRRGKVFNVRVYDGGVAFGSKEQSEGAQFINCAAINCHAGSSGVFRAKGSAGTQFVDCVDYIGTPVAAADIGVRMMANATDVWATADRSGALSTGVAYRRMRQISRSQLPQQAVSIGGPGDASTATFERNTYDLPGSAQSAANLFRYQTSVYSGATWRAGQETDAYFGSAELYDPNVVRRLGIPLASFGDAELLAAAARRVV